MPEIRSYLKADVPRDIAMQIVSGVRFTWPGFLDGKTPAWEATPYLARGRHFVLMDDDMLVSHALVSYWPIAHAGQTFTVFGLSSVFCFPGYRGKGLGEQVVAAATQHIRRQADADFALLFCGDRVKSLYLRQGWQQIPTLKVTFGADKQIYSDGIVLALLVSDRARRMEFVDTLPLHVGDKTW